MKNSIKIGGYLVKIIKNFEKNGWKILINQYFNNPESRVSRFQLAHASYNNLYAHLMTNNSYFMALLRKEKRFDVRNSNKDNKVLVFDVISS